MSDTSYEARIAKADALRDKGELEIAEHLYREVLNENPELALAHYKLGVCLARRGFDDEAIAAYRKTLDLDGEYPEAASNLGRLLAKQHNWAEAEALFNKALAARPDFFDAHQGLGNLLLDLCRYDEACYHYQRAIALRPEDATSFQRLGETFRRDDRPEDAIANLQKALTLAPDSWQAWNSLGSCHLGLSEAALAKEAFCRAAEVAPHETAPLKNMALATNYMVVEREDSYAIHVQAGELIRQQLAEHRLKPGYSQSADRERRLRVGFVSGDFRRHSVSYFILSVLRELDHRSYEFHAYFTAPAEDLRTREFHALFHHWHKVHGMPVPKVAELIKQHQIDILIDLSGFTNHSMTEAFVLKPAPVQMTWIGYPNTLGLPEIQYRLTDEWADPAEEGNAYHAEELLRVPGGFLCYSPYAKAPQVSALPADATGTITFGSFNQRTKLSAECIALWSRVLLSVPDSRLVLKSVFGMGEGQLRDTLVAAFAKNGVAADRLVFLTGETTTEGHLERYSEIDIALDTFPYNGTTTTCEALWMGVPVISRMGDRHAARVGVSILSSVGLKELVARDDEDFVRIAHELATDLHRLRELRDGMRDRLKASPLLNAKRMATYLEATWRELWQRYCDSPDTRVEEMPVGDSPLLRLNVGGKEHREGWKILDIEPGEDVDVVADVLDLMRFDDASCAEIYCSHVLQCLPTGDVLEALQSFYRILVPGGTLYLAVPDLETLSDLYGDADLSPAQKFEVMRRIFGQQEHDHDFNRTGFGFDLMVTYLEDVGFTKVEHVESFGMFEDGSEARIAGTLVSLNLLVTK